MFLVKIPYKKIWVLVLILIGLGMFIYGSNEGKDAASKVQIHKHPNLMEYIKEKENDK